MAHIIFTTYTLEKNKKKTRHLDYELNKQVQIEHKFLRTEIAGL